MGPTTSPPALAVEPTTEATSAVGRHRAVPPAAMVAEREASARMLTLPAEWAAESLQAFRRGSPLGSGSDSR